MDERERRLLNHIGHAVFILEPGADGLPRYQSYNKFALSSLGKAEEEVLGLTACDVFPGRLGKAAFEHHVQALQTGAERTYEILLPLSAGHRRVRTRLSPELDGHGNVVRLIGSSTDISGQQLVAEVRASVETINNEMEDFINLAAHDLRAPMRHIGMIADMLREDFQDHGDGKLELIDMLEDVGTKAMSLIGDVLAHAQATGSDVEYFEFDFSDLLDEIMGLLDPMNDCEIEVPRVRIEADRTAIQMILRNLIDNAIKCAKAKDFSDAGAPCLRLSLTIEEAEGFVEIGVKDNGVGFEDTAIVFLNGGKLRTDSGFGMLGVRRLIHARGGTLTATNAADNSGALVAFSLPGKLLRKLI